GSYVRSPPAELEHFAPSARRFEAAPAALPIQSAISNVRGGSYSFFPRDETFFIELLERGGGLIVFAHVLFQPGSGPQHVFAREGVGAQERLWILDSGGIFDRVVIDSGESFDDVQRVGIDLRSLKPFLEAGHIDDKGVSFPVTDRVPKPRRIQVLRM